MPRKLAEKEFLDVPGSATREEIEDNLRLIAWTNRWLGGTRVIISHLDQLIGSVNYERSIRILDLGSGQGDILVAVERWAEMRSIRVEITGIEHNPVVLKSAKRFTAGSKTIHLVQGDIRQLNYANDAFDIVTCSLIIHALSDSEVVALFRTANRIASLGIIISDLTGGWICRTVVGLAAHAISNRVSSHDARVSFQNAFTPHELAALASSAELPHYRITVHHPCRLALVVDKRNMERISNPTSYNMAPT